MTIKKTKHSNILLYLPYMNCKLLVFKFLVCFVFLCQSLEGQLGTNDFVIRQYTIDHGLPSNSIYSCAIDSFGYLWFATENGLSRFDGKNFRNFDESHGLLENMILGVWIKNEDIIGLGFKGASILKKKPDIYTVHKISLGNEKKSKFKSFGKDLFCFLNDTIELMDFQNANTLKIKFDDTNKLNYYFGQDFNLLRKFKNLLNHKIDLGKYSIIIANGNNVTTENIFLSKNGKIIDSLSFQNRLGAYLFDRNNQLLLVNSNKISILRIVKDKLVIAQTIILSSYNVNGCLQIGENTFIMTSIDKGFFIFQKKQGLDTLSYNKYLDFSDWLNINKLNRGAKCYEKWNKDTILVGTSGGVALFDGKKSKMGNIFFHTRTYSLHTINSKEFYIGSIGGLYLYNFITKKSKKLYLGIASESKINSIAHDQQGNIWVSAASKGIYLLDKQHKIIKYYNKFQGLITNDIYKIQIDHKNRKWFSSNKGLQILDTEGFFRLDKNDGLISNEVLDFELHGDTAWISTPLGKQSYVYQNPIARIDIPLYFNSFSINNVAMDAMPSKLNPGEDKIEFNFIGIYYPSPDNIEYRYKLIKDGKETPWQKTIETKLIFEKLQWGDYELLIKAIHNNYPNVYSQVLSKKFYIKPYFYQTIWFYAFITALVLGSIFYFFYRRNKGKLKTLLYERELAKLKLEALKAEMNPHFIFNVLNTIKESMMEGDFDTSQNLLDRLAKVIRQALYNSKRDFLTLEEEINFIEQYIELERERFNKRFEFIKKINNNILHYEVPTMLLQPFIENAIRHGKIGQLAFLGKLYFEVSETDNDLIIIIRDNGLGLEKAKQKKEANHPGHKSMALEIIQERITLFKKTHGIRIKLEIVDSQVEDYKTEVRLTIEKEKNI